VTRNKRDEWRLLVMWEFIVRPGKEPLFERIYGPNGDWAACFCKGEGYCGTDLSRDIAVPVRYITMDFWKSQEAYETFKAEHAAEYKALDQKCESLTEQEREIGRFERVIT
jgi:quinol monooxygenase YgiN